MLPGFKTDKKTATSVTKSRSLPVVDFGTFYYHAKRADGSTIYRSPCYDGSYTPLYEVISYENTFKKRFGNCVHRKVSRAFTDLSGDRTVNLPYDLHYPNNVQPHSSEGSVHGWQGPIRGGLVNSQGVAPASIDEATGWFTCPGVDVDRLLFDAMASMRPKIEEELSLLVTLAELSDLKTLVTSPLEIARTILSKGSKVLNLLKATGKTLLTHQFGSKQTLNDVMALYSHFMGIDAKLSQLLRGVGKVHTSHYSPENQYSDEYYEVSAPSAHSGNTSSCGWRRAKAYQKCYVTMKYTYAIVDAWGNPIVDPELLRFGAHLDSLGIRGNPALVWDLIPFSFVVDYFVSIGDWLESFSSRNLNSQVQILDMCYSIKNRSTTVWHAEDWMRTVIGGDPSKGALHGQYTFTLIENEYIRRRCFPKPDMLHSPALSLSSPSWRQWLTMGSLITANLP